MTTSIESLQKLSNFAKENKIKKLMVEGIEIEFHPSAFITREEQVIKREVEEALSEEQKIELERKEMNDLLFHSA